MTQPKFFLDYFFKNATKIYLILTNLVLVIFAIWFSNVGLLPFKNLEDFVFFAILALILGIYRPGWVFAFFVGALVLENVNLAPREFSISIRPYQFFGLIAIASFLMQTFSKRSIFSLPKWKWVDALVLIFAISGFLSTMAATNKGVSFKQSIVSLSFVAIYFLVRIFVQCFSDLKKIMPFFLGSGLIIMLYSVWQNIRFLKGANAFEIMPGRPNGTFTEADWLGIFLVFILSVVYGMLYFLDNSGHKERLSLSNIQYPIFIKLFNRKTLLYFASSLLYVVLIMTVSRSAWLGAGMVFLGYLKLTLLYSSENEDFNHESRNFWHAFLELLKKRWQWKNFIHALVLSIVTLIFSVGIIFLFHLTNFQLGNRAVSAGGLQKITIACKAGFDHIVPQKISNLDELANLDCRHINLEEIEQEKTLGNVVLEIYRDDPNVNIRKLIYQKSLTEIKANPILGIGWGGIGNILGKDERGTGLNASNIFLEIWLGAGLLGIISFLTLLSYIFIKASGRFVKSRGESIECIFVLLGLFAILIPNMFNSGIFLGFVWFYLAIAVSLLSVVDEKNN